MASTAADNLARGVLPLAAGCAQECRTSVVMQCQWLASNMQIYCLLPFFHGTLQELVAYNPGLGCNSPEDLVQPNTVICGRLEDPPIGSADGTPPSPSPSPAVPPLPRHLQFPLGVKGPACADLMKAFESRLQAAVATTVHVPPATVSLTCLPAAPEQGQGSDGPAEPSSKVTAASSGSGSRPARQHVRVTVMLGAYSPGKAAAARKNLVAALKSGLLKEALAKALPPASADVKVLPQPSQVTCKDAQNQPC
ncbi:hypothetical protein N2152v2_004038 [Parachlorella kessleri]